MAIPSSGQLALSTIRDEFGAGTTSNVSLRTLSAAAGLSVPDGFNEFYGLASYTPPSLGSWGTSQSGAGTQANPYILTSTSFTNYTFDQEVGVCGEYIADIQFYFRQRVSERYISSAFTVQSTGSQRMHITMTNQTSSNFNCTYFDPYVALATFQVYGAANVSRVADYPSNLVGQVQNVTADFNTSVGSTIGLGVGAIQPRNEIGYVCDLYPDDNYAYYNTTFCSGPLPFYSSVTFSVWFEKL